MITIVLITIGSLEIDPLFYYNSLLTPRGTFSNIPPTSRNLVNITFF